jgi:redox-sensitive bicupin YhaK (pirin superfamily)
MSELAHPAVDLVIVPPARDIGGFEVRRALPSRQRQMVGPFIFLDQIGPAQLAAGQGIDVRPHPHIGLATVTYLFAGSLMHRDSEGNAIEIAPGAMNLMTAGRGIVHSERTPQATRASSSPLSGMQSWLALPRSHEEVAPSFQRFDADQLPVVQDAGLHARVIAGAAFGQRSPVDTASDWLYVDVRLDTGISAPFDADIEERGIYIAEGSIEIADQTFEAPQLLVLRPGDAITLTAVKPARVMFLGGAGIDGPRYIWWNFVSSSKERIEQAKADWQSGRFDPVPGEHEFIPLPER